jgi:hypothetical protein
MVGQAWPSATETVALMLCCAFCVRGLQLLLRRLFGDAPS